MSRRNRYRGRHHCEGFATSRPRFYTATSAEQRLAWTDGLTGIEKAVSDSGETHVRGRDVERPEDRGRPGRQWDAGSEDGHEGQTQRHRRLHRLESKRRLEDTSKAEFEVAKARLEAAAAIQREYLKETQEAYDDSYKHNLISIRDYYDERTVLEQQALQAEMDAKQQEIAANRPRKHRDHRSGAPELEGPRDQIDRSADGDAGPVREHGGHEQPARDRSGTTTRGCASRGSDGSKINVGNSQVAMDRIALDQRKSLRQGPTSTRSPKSRPSKTASPRSRQTRSTSDRDRAGRAQRPEKSLQ